MVHPRGLTFSGLLKSRILVKFLEDLLGFVTHFDTSIGKFEAVILTPQGPLYHSGTGPEDFARQFKQAIALRNNANDF